jgi:Flp pilus assembly protein TadD
MAGLAHAHFMAGNDAAALAWSGRAMTMEPGWANAYRARIVVLCRMGRQAEARQAASQLLAVAPQIRAGFSAEPYRDPGFRASYADALRQAGIPD